MDLIRTLLFMLTTYSAVDCTSVRIGKQDKGPNPWKLLMGTKHIGSSQMNPGLKGLGVLRLVIKEPFYH